jgi:ATP synthase protein I
MTTYLMSAPVRATLRWQAGATLGVALVAGVWGGIDGAISAVLGGLITVIAGIAFAIVVSIKNSPSAEATLVTMFLAEGAKIAAIILLLWVVITAYKDLVGAAFFTAFVITVLLNRVAFWVRNAEAGKPDKTEWK